MPTRICPTAINCDCIETPYANLSAELAEPYIFVSPRTRIINPPIARTFQQLGCKRWCYSAVSQADADACAALQATECATVLVVDPPIIIDPPDPPVSFPRVSVFATEPSTSFGEEPGVFNLSRTGSLAQPLTVHFTLSGEAQNGVDYETLPYTVTIDAGDSSVDVIVIPMDTGEVVSKSVVLTILGGSNYAPGASASDTVEITPGDCGEPAFRINGYGEALAIQIAAMFPDAPDSELPEWDGILRQIPGLEQYRSNGNCYAINGKAIEVNLTLSQVLVDSRGCPSGWLSAEPTVPGCKYCFEFTDNDLFTSDLIAINDPTLRFDFVSFTTGALGNYQSFTSASCHQIYAGRETFHVSGDDRAHSVYGGSTFLSVVAL